MLFNDQTFELSNDHIISQLTYRVELAAYSLSTMVVVVVVSSDLAGDHRLIL